MTTGTETALGAVRAHATGPAAAAVASLVTDLFSGLAGRNAGAVLYFASSAYDPMELAGPITASFPGAAVIGCSTAGEFTDAVTGTGGISAMALPREMIRWAVAAVGDLRADVAAGTQIAVQRLESSLGVPLRALDGERHIGFILIDGMHAAEEQVNETLGYAAPLLEFVGGSAGDDLAFEHTWVAAGEEISYQGVALMVCEAAVPFHVVKTCSFVSTGTLLQITEADEDNRDVRRINGRPAAEVYAEAVGVPLSGLDSSVWMRHPLGLMIHGEPWIRSPQAVTPGGGVKFYAQLRTGAYVEVMAASDLIADTRQTLAQARAGLSGRISGALLFNCILRRLEMDADGSAAEFLAALQGIPTAGFHTYGESWLGHINQTLTGVVFG